MMNFMMKNRVCSLLMALLLLLLSLSLVLTSCGNLGIVLDPFGKNDATVNEEDEPDDPWGGNETKEPVIADELEDFEFMEIGEGEYSFYGVKNKDVTSCVIPEGFTQIRVLAFDHYLSLTSVVIPASMQEIEELAFARCQNLESIVVAEGNPRYKVVDNCLIDIDTKTLICGLKGAVIPADGSVEVIGEGAFCGCKIEQIVIPDTVTEIRSNAFSECDSLQSVSLPGEITAIAPHTFIECESLESIELPEGVTTIGDRAFSSCYALTSMVIPNSVTELGEYVFESCFGLTELTIGDGLTEFSMQMIENSTALKSLTIGASVKKFTRNGQAYPALERITVSEGNEHYVVTSNCLIESETYTLVLGSIDGKMPTDGSVLIIGEYAFYGLTGIEVLDIPNSVQEIRAFAFADCTSIKTLIFPVGSVESVASTAFIGCAKSLEEIQGVHGVFYPNTEEGLQIHYKVVNNCLIRLEEEDSDNDGNYNVYYASLILGANNAIIPDHVRRIAAYAFMHSSIESVVIPSSVRMIETRAFYDCDRIERVVIPERVSFVEEEAFGECDVLESIVLYGDVVLGGYSFTAASYFTVGAFTNCPKLKTVYFAGTSDKIDVEFRGTDETVQNATWYFYSATEPEKPGNYWHYKDGEVRVW